MVSIAAIQFSMSPESAENLANADKLIRQAAANGAQIILLPELFERPYFCKTQRAEFIDYASTAADNAAVCHCCRLAAELQVVMPVSFYEQDGNARFNSIVMIDADGEMLGVYRKSHIPDGPGYQEKFYFSPGDTGFRVWRTKYGSIGVGICWDQWFPEAARAMALQGADVLLYPTAIGSEPQSPGYESAAHWQAAICGHAAANVMPVVTANRIGDEQQEDALGNGVQMSFYGRSFIADVYGKIVADAENADNAVILHSFDFSRHAKERSTWGLFRDRRPDLYGALLNLGMTK